MDVLGAYFCYVGLLLLGYGVYYGVACLWWKWEHVPKGPALHYENARHLVLEGSLVYLVAGVSHHLDYVFVAAYVVGLFGFGALGQLPCAHNDLSNCLCQGGCETWSLYAFGVLTVLGIAGFHLYLATLVNVIFNYYLPALAFAVSWFMVAAFIRAWFSSTVCFHVHHATLFFVFAYFCMFDSLVSRLCIGITLGVATQGTAAYSYPYTLLVDVGDIDSLNGDHSTHHGAARNGRCVCCREGQDSAFSEGSGSSAGKVLA